MTYNGWSNYETWCVNLWLTNEQGSYNFCRDLAQGCWRDAEASKTFSRKEQAALDAADCLKQFINDSQPEVTGMFRDLLNAALSEVDWHEIAEHFIADVIETVEEEEQ